MGKMTKFSPERARVLEAIVLRHGYPAELRKMFGHETWFLNGHMFTGASVDGIYVHVGEAEKETALKTEKDASPFQPVRGMVMKEYLLLGEPSCSDPKKLKKWLDRGQAYLASLPKKKKKKQ